MKKFAILILLSAGMMSGMLAVSCGGSKNGPRQIADKFTKAYYLDIDFGTTREYVSEELRLGLPEEGKMGELEKMFVDVLKEHGAEYGYRADYDDSRSNFGDTTAVFFYNLTARGNPEWKGGGEVELAKDAEGRWIVVDYRFDRDDEAIDFGF